jgi:hypothetical protein
MREMKRIPVILLSGLLVAGCSAPPNPIKHTTTYLPNSLPAGWVVNSSTNPEQFKPLRGLNYPIAQLTLANASVTLKRELVPGKTKVFHPNLILLVFPKSELDVVEQAVRQNVFRSDYPPIIFGLTDEHVFVTSPGYVNEGLHTPEAETTIQELRTSLKKTMGIK